MSDMRKLARMQHLRREKIFTAVEEMPVFKEGNVLAYMARMVKYPVRAQEKGIQGKVIVSFVIDKAGRVTDPQVVRSVDQDLDREALRVVKALPDWIPGKQRGVAVDVFYTLPIEFRLQSDAETPPFREKRMNRCDRPFNSKNNGR